MPNFIWSPKGLGLHGFEEKEDRAKSKRKRRKKKEEEKKKSKVWNPSFWVFGMNSHGELMLLGLGFWKRSPKP